VNSLNTIDPKDPADVDLYVIDFRLLFVDPDYIVSFTVSVSSTDLTVVSSQQVGKQIQVLLGGGIAGKVYSLGVTAVGNDSRTIHRSIPISVKDL
jgi:hypothetical protein